MHIYRLLGTLFVALLIMIVVGECERSKVKKSHEEAALKERIKAEIKAEMEQERAKEQADASNEERLKEAQEAQSLADYRAKIEADIRADEQKKALEEQQRLLAMSKSMPAGRQVAQEVQQPREVSTKEMLKQKLKDLEIEMRTNGGYGAKLLNEQYIETLRALADIESNEKGGSTSSYEQRQLRRQQDDFQRQMEEQRRALDNQRDDQRREMESQVHQHQRALEDQRRELESQMASQRRDMESDMRQQRQELEQSILISQ